MSKEEFNIDWKAWWEISRPKHIPIVSGGTALALYVLGATDPVQYALGATIGGVMVTGAIIHNDYIDREVDRIAKPHRPIPSGRIRPETANVVGHVMMMIGALLSFYMGFIPGMIASGLYALSYYYNAKAKKDHAAVGNIVVAACVAATLYFPMAIVGSTELWPQALGFFIIEWYREIFITCQDFYGDREAGYRTLPVLIGRARTLSMSHFMIWFSLPFLLYTLNENLDWVYKATVSIFILILLAGWFRVADIEINPKRTFSDEEKERLFQRYQFWGRRLAKNALVVLIAAMFVDMLI